MNHQHKYYLVEAELARVKDKDIKAIKLYDKAIALAKKNEYISDEAIANEVAARFYLSRGMVKSAISYMQESRYCYYRWGAYAKVKDLDTRYPQLLKTTSTDRKKPGTIPISTTMPTEVSSEVFDMEAVMKFSQTLSSEIISERLLAQFMKIAVENTGAKRGFFLIERLEKPIIEVWDGLATDKTGKPKSVFFDTNVHKDVLPLSVIQYSRRTYKSIVFSESIYGEIYHDDPYLLKVHPESILCMPIVNHGILMGLVYLENDTTKGVFTPDRQEFLKILSSQMAISMENARLYNQMEQKVVTRTKELESDLDKLKKLNTDISGLSSEIGKKQKDLDKLEKNRG